MRIIVDMQGLQSSFSGHRGVGRYTENIVRQLILQKDARHEIYLALNGGLSESVLAIRAGFADILPAERILTWQQFFDTNAMLEPEPGLIEVGEVIRETFLFELQPDVIFSTNLQEGLMDSAVTSVHRLDLPVLYCSTLHDVIPYFYPEYLENPVVRAWYSRKIEAAQTSDILLTVSESSKRDIVDKLGVPPEKIFVVENGYDCDLFNPAPLEKAEADSLRQKYKLPKTFLLYYGGGDKHKNIDRLLRAYASLPLSIRDDVALVLAGKEARGQGYIQDLIANLALDSHVITPGYVAGDDLPAVLKMSIGFVFPSTHEGFGLPVLEAMACGVAVIGGDNSSIKDILNNPKATFDPYNEEDMAGRLRFLATDANYRAALIASHQKEVKKYSWRKSAKKLWAIFESFENLVSKTEPDLGDPVQRVLGHIVPFVPGMSQQALLDISRSITESFPLQRGKKIYIDISSVIRQDHRSGIQRVTRAIAGEVLKAGLDGFDIELVYSGVSELHFYAAKKYTQEIFGLGSSLHDNYVEFQPGDILLYLDLHPGVAISHKDYNLYLRNKGIEVYHVVYDIIPILKPQMFWPELCHEFMAWVDAISVSDGAICISQAVADELSVYLSKFGEKRADLMKIGWFHLGADLESSVPTTGIPNEAASLIARLESCVTFLNVGTLEPRKGHRQTLAAFERLWNEGTHANLVFIGRHGWGMDDFTQLLEGHPQLNKRLFWLHGVSDEYLEKIYEASSCLIASSEAEGFGLPLIEAAQKGIPIIARDIPVFREVAGVHAFYFENSTAPLTLAKAVKAWLELREKNLLPVSSGMPYRTWKQSANQLIDVIQKGTWRHSIVSCGALRPYDPQNHRSKRLKWSGFSDPEAHHRWTKDHEVTIAFQWGGEERNAQLRLFVSSLGRQRVILSFNGESIGEDVVEGRDYPLVRSLRGIKSGDNIVKLSLPDARQFSETDHRLLALAVHQVEIAAGGVTLRPAIKEDHMSRVFDWHGFNAPEESFRWTGSKMPWLSFLSEGEVVSSVMEIEVTTLGRQTVKVWLDQTKIFDKIVAGQHAKIVLPFKNLKEGYHVLRFELPDARPPGNGDDRILGLAVRNLILKIR